MNEAHYTPGQAFRALPRWQLLPAVLFLLCVLVYVAYRAAVISFSWDEAYSYMHHVRKGVLWPVDLGHMGANHHLLNVWGMIAADRLLGNLEWQLRLPSVLGFCLFGAAALWHAKEARNGVLALMVVAFLTLHPFMLDMFSLARGYGLGLGFMMMSLVLARNEVMAPDLRKLIGSLVMAGCAALSNLVWLNFLLALPLAFLVLHLVRTRGSWPGPRFFVSVVLSTGTFLAVLLPIAIQLREGGGLYFGSDSTADAFGSMASLMFYYLSEYPDPVRSLQVALWLIGALVGLSLCVGLWKRDAATWGAILLPLLVLLVWVSSIAVQHVWLDTPLPKARTAIGFLPLVAFCTTSALLSPVLGTRLPTVFAILLTLPLVQLQYRAFTTKYFIEWRVSGELRTMLEIIRSEAQFIRKERPFHTVTTAFGCWMPLLYYKYSRNLDDMIVAQLGSGHNFRRSDHYIMEYDCMDRVDTVNWTERFSGPHTNTHLFRQEVNFTKRRLQVLDTTSFTPSLGEEVMRLEGAGVEGYGLVHVFDTITANAPVMMVHAPTKRMCSEDWVGVRLEIRGRSGLMDQVSVSTPEDLEKDTWGAVDVVFQSAATVHVGDTLAISVWTSNGACIQFVKPVDLVIYALPAQFAKGPP